MPVGASGGTSLIDVLDRVLDKGIVIDAWVRALAGRHRPDHRRSARGGGLHRHLPQVFGSRGAGRARFQTRLGRQDPGGVARRERGSARAAGRGARSPPCRQGKAPARGLIDASSALNRAETRSSPESRRAAFRACRGPPRAVGVAAVSGGLGKLRPPRAAVARRPRGGRAIDLPAAEGEGRLRAAGRHGLRPRPLPGLGGSHRRQRDPLAGALVRRVRSRRCRSPSTGNPGSLGPSRRPAGITALPSVCCWSPTWRASSDMHWVAEAALGAASAAARPRGSRRGGARVACARAALLDSIINAVTDPILLTDTDGRLIIREPAR